MAWRTKCQFATTAAIREEELMLDLAFGGSLFEEARRELVGKVRAYGLR